MDKTLVCPKCKESYRYYDALDGIEPQDVCPECRDGVVDEKDEYETADIKNRKQFKKGWK